MNQNKTLYLIDGSSYIYRAYFAIRHLSSPTGFPTNAIYGFIQMLLKLLKDYEPQNLAVVFDAGRITFRNEIYPEYKANREATPEDLKVQMGPIRDVVRAFNIPTLQLDGYEADDIIGTIAVKFANQGKKVVVVTGDKDLMQIVSEQITLLDTMKMKTSGIKEVIERFGVPPELVIDILALSGDTSDNIPGIPGIGDKTAAKLIQEFGSLKQLLERSDEVKGKNSERLREFAAQAELSRRLATIELNVPMEINSEDFTIQPPNQEALHALFKEYGFTTLIKDLSLTPTLDPGDYHNITTNLELNALIEQLKNAGSFAFYLEKNTSDSQLAEIVSFSFSFKNHEAYRVEVKQLGLQPIVDSIIPFFKNTDFKIIGHNLKPDLQLLKNIGITAQGNCFDTMLASYLLNPNLNNHSLDTLTEKYLNSQMSCNINGIDNKNEQLSLSGMPSEKASQNAMESVDAIWRLYDILEQMLLKTKLTDLFNNLEIPLISVLAEMENHGVLLDINLLDNLSTDFATRNGVLEEQIFSLAGERFNLNSPKQLGEVLFERMGLKSVKKYKGKNGWSTDNEVLSALAENNEIANLILSYRSTAKLKSTYSDALPRLVNKQTGRIHTSYNQTVTNTGRLSSSDPNLQNIPIRTEEGRLIRHAFIAPPDYFIMSADYSQIELRVLAHLSNDKILCHAFTNDEDIHTRTAAEVFGLFPEMVTPEMRRQAKTINFGIIYGQGAFSLAKQLGISRKSADDFINAYKERYKDAMKYLDSCIEEAEKFGYVTTILGRRLPIPDIYSSNANILAFARRNAINYPIQGSAADIIKSAMIRISKRIKLESMGSTLIMQVHDELVFEVPQNELIKMEQLIEEEMGKAVDCRVPLKVDISYGSNWSEAH